MASIFVGLDAILARNPNGSNNDGDGNNANDVGEVGDAFIRITEASYFTNGSDGTFGGPFGPPGPNGMALPVAPTNPPAIPIPQPGLVGDLPQAHAVSDAVMALGPLDQNHPSSFAVNEMFDFFGQFLTHDVAEAATGNSGDIALLIDGLPFPFGRTPYELDDEGVRQQHNEETSFLDLSMVYGNSQAREDLARADTSPGSGIQSAKLLLGADGLLPTIKEVALDSGIDNNPLQTGAMEVLSIFTEVGFGGLPDPADNDPDSDFENLFYAGDNRVNQQAPLITQQTIWAREHNYQVDQLTPYATSQGWTQDQLFEAARAINEAEFQHVVFEEYLPKLQGTHADALLAAYKATHPDIAPGIINEWTTVAFRFGHDQSSNDYKLLNADGSTYMDISLGAAFNLAGAAQNVPGAGHSATDIDAWIRGLSAQYAQEIDGFVADGNRAALFGINTADLEAFDIQRGRDHGVWNYNLLRAGLGLQTYADFDEFAAANGYAPDDARILALKNVYFNDINKLDSIVGGMLEKKYYDSQLGETFTLLNAIQFDVLKAGDPFYYQNRLAGNPELLAGIMGVTVAEIVARNSGVDHLHLDGFGVANRMEFGNGSDYKFGADLAANLKADLMIGKNGNDSLYGKEGIDTLYGDGGNDTLDGGKGNDFLRGGTGNDLLIGGQGDDNANGDEGNDIINMDSGDDWASGGLGNDIVNGGDGNDILLGKEGNDAVNGGQGDDEVFGGDGNDIVNGDGGNDKVYGGAGEDIVNGGTGNDELHGEDGNDQLSGGTGNDTLDGGAGNDRLDGGAGLDTFVFAADFGSDRITGFDANPAGGQDLIDLSDFGFVGPNLFAAHVTVTDVGADTLVTIDGQADQVIRLVGIGNSSLIDANDFVFV
jgi:Ca2+-binding RTX toxin-like protein